MSQDEQRTASRRGFLKMVGGGVVLLPLAGIGGCSGDNGQTAAKPAPAPRADSQSPPSSPEPAPGLPHVSEDDPTSKALGYRHNAADVDTARFPQHASDQLCRNCSLFQAGSAGDQWAPCAIFPGKAVNAGGWCSAWVAAG